MQGCKEEGTREENEPTDVKIGILECLNPCCTGDFESLTQKRTLLYLQFLITVPCKEREKMEPENARKIEQVDWRGKM